MDETVLNIGHYEVVLLGFPIWGQTVPPVLRAFMSEHDVSGKVLVLFSTHGGYGLGDSLDVLTQHAPGAHVLEVFVMAGEQERKTMEKVIEWLQHRRA